MMWMIQPRVPAEPIQVKPPRIIHSSPRRNLPLYIWPSPGSKKLRMAAVPGLRIGSLVVAVKKLAAGPHRPARASTAPPRPKFQQRKRRVSHRDAEQPRERQKLDAVLSVAPRLCVRPVVRELGNG